MAYPSAPLTRAQSSWIALADLGSAVTADDAATSPWAWAVGDAGGVAVAWGLGVVGDAVGCVAGCSEPGFVLGETTVGLIVGRGADEPASDARVRVDGRAGSTDVMMPTSTNPVSPAATSGQTGRHSGAWG